MITLARSMTRQVAICLLLAVPVALPASAVTGDFLFEWGVAGTGDGQFEYLQDLAVDATGNVYVLDINLSYPRRSRVQVFDAHGLFLDSWLAYEWPTRGMAVDAAGRVYLTSEYARKVAVFDMHGTPLFNIPMPSALSYCNAPRGVSTYTAPGSGTTRVYVTLEPCNTVEAFDVVGNTATWQYRLGVDGWCPSDHSPSGDDYFSCPYRSETDESGNLYVADSSNHRIQVFDPAGNFVTRWGVAGTDPGEFRHPIAVAADGLGNVFVAEPDLPTFGSQNNRVQAFYLEGESPDLFAFWGGLGSGQGEFHNPWAIAVHPTDNLVYVLDNRNRRIQVFEGADADGDLVSDAMDNCLGVANPDQADSNNDGYGDACIDPDVVLGPGVTIGAGTVVDRGVTIGDYTTLGEGVRISKDVSLGSSIFIGDGTAIGQSVDATNALGLEIGPDCVISRRVTFVGQGIRLGAFVSVAQGVRIESAAQIGNGTRIEKDVTVRKGCIIGADCVIESNVTIPPGTVIPDGTVVTKKSVF